MEFNWKKYVAVFLITALIFLTALYLGNTISSRKLDSLRAIQEQLATDILSSETRFSLLERTSCEHVIDDAVLSEELHLFGSRLAVMERQLGSNDERVKQLKRYYSVIQIKDYLLLTDLAEKCDTDPAIILYFYEDSCSECRRQGYALSELQREHPEVRVYSFDSRIESSAVRTLMSIYDVGKELPTVVIDDNVYVGFQSILELKNLLPGLEPRETGEENRVEENAQE